MRQETATVRREPSRFTESTLYASVARACKTVHLLGFYTGSHVKTKIGSVETVKYVNNTLGSPEEKIFRVNLGIGTAERNLNRFTRVSV